MNFSEMPVEIWADLLEEQGEDTTELREWIASGLRGGEEAILSAFCITDFGGGHCITKGDGDNSGYGDGDNSGYGDGYGNGNEGCGNGNEGCGNGNEGCGSGDDIVE